MVAATILKNTTKPEVRFSSQTVVDTSIILKPNRKSLLQVCLCSFRHISTSGLAKNGCQWPIFTCNARITPHSRWRTGAEYYRTSTDNWSTASSSTGSEYSTSQVTGSTLMPFRGFQVVDLRGHTTVFVVSVKPEVIVDRK